MEAVSLVISAVLLFAVDQWMKVCIISWLPHGETSSFGPVTIRIILNQRVYGRLRRGAYTMLGLWVVELFLFITLAESESFAHGATARIALGAALGGAASNLFDCLWRDGVIDFVDFGFWPVFNLADVAIVAGVLIGVICI